MIAGLFKAGRAEGTDALRAGEAVAAIGLWLTVEISARIIGDPYAQWVDKLALLAAGVTLISASAMFDAIPSYPARNAAGKIVIGMWLAVAFRIGTGQSSLSAALQTLWWLTVLVTCTFILGAGEWAETHPITKALWGTLREARGDVLGPIRGLYHDARNGDQRARLMLHQVCLDSASAIAAMDGDSATVLMRALQTLTTAKPGEHDGLFGTDNARSEAREKILGELHDAWFTCDLGRIKATFGRVQTAAALPHDSTPTSARLLQNGPRITIKTPADKEGAVIRIPIVAQVLADMLRLPLAAVHVERTPGGILVDLATIDHMATAGRYDT